MSAFDLGRMRHLDLPALWHRAHPNSRGHWGRHVAALSKENLAAAILASPA